MVILTSLGGGPQMRLGWFAPRGRSQFAEFAEHGVSIAGRDDPGLVGGLPGCSSGEQCRSGVAEVAVDRPPEFGVAVLEWRCSRYCPGWFR